EGLSPAIAIQQRAGSRNPRSTVGTVTEIHDYLRLLFARIGIPHCPRHQVEITPQGVDRISASVLERFKGQRIDLLASVVRGKKGEYRDLFEDLRRQGFRRVLVDGVETRTAPSPPSLVKNRKHDIEVVVDSFLLKEEERSRLAEGIELCQRLANGLVGIRGPGGARASYS
ncbi:excinuclease ABC subunit A, partial [mine drainage metagenome]